MINLLPLDWLTGLLFSVFSIASTPVRWTAGPAGCPWAATGTGGGLVRRRGGCGRGGSVYTHAAGAAALQQGRGAGVPIAISAVARGGAAARRWKLYAYPALGNANSARRRAPPPAIWPVAWPVPYNPRKSPWPLVIARPCYIPRPGPLGNAFLPLPPWPMGNAPPPPPLPWRKSGKQSSAIMARGHERAGNKSTSYGCVESPWNLEEKHGP